MMGYVLMLIRFAGLFFWLYAFLCSIRIVLTWIPGIENSFTRFLSKVCDPYLNFFSKHGILRIGVLDFSPILSIALLSLGAMLCSNIADTAKLTFASFLSSIISTAWSIVISILLFFTFIFIIRLIALLFQNNSYKGSTFWKMIDTTFGQIIFGIANTFSRGKLIPFRTALIIDTVTLIILMTVGNVFIDRLIKLVNLIPF